MIEFYISSTKYTLQERQTKRGKVYDVVFRVVDLSGEEHQKKLCGYFTKTAAKEAYADFVTAKCELVKNNPIKKKKSDIEKNRGVYTVKDIFPAYITSLANQAKETTIYDRQNLYRLFILPMLGDLKMPELTKERLYQWQDDLWGTKNPKSNDFYSYEYLIKIRSLLGAFLSWAETRYGYKSYMDEVKRPRRKEAKREMEIWTRAEFEQFLSVIDLPVYRAFFATLFFCGCRKSEALALTPADVTNDAISITKSIIYKTLDGAAFKSTPTKAYKNREVPIATPLRAEFEDYISTVAGKAYLFSGDRPIPHTNVDRAFDKYVKKAGVKKIRIHDLRHSFVSMLIHLGANLTVVADLIGDTLEQVTKTYAHMYETDRAAVMMRIS